MAKQKVYQRFITALKGHWRTALPDVKPLSNPLGPLPKSSSFDAGFIPTTGQHVFLQFQTTWQEAGKFTINLIVVDEGCELSDISENAYAWKCGGRLPHGAHRIATFLENVRHDKWWYLCADREDLLIDNADWRERRIRIRANGWAVDNYENEAQVIESAVEDVTRDVATALRAVGATGVGRI
jgi:hypothetical protein